MTITYLREDIHARPTRDPDFEMDYYPKPRPPYLVINGTLHVFETGVDATTSLAGIREFALDRDPPMIETLSLEDLTGYDKLFTLEPVKPWTPLADFKFLDEPAKEEPDRFELDTSPDKNLLQFKWPPSGPEGDSAHHQRSTQDRSTYNHQTQGGKEARS